MHAMDNPNMMRMMWAMQLQWFDDPIPMLENTTPRQASTTAHGRQLLERLLTVYEQMEARGSPNDSSGFFSANPSRARVYDQLQYRVALENDVASGSVVRGCNVELHSLQSNELNGMYGTVVGTASDGRLPVRLTDCSSKRVRIANLRLVSQRRHAWFSLPAKAQTPGGVSSWTHVEVRSMPAGCGVPEGVRYAIGCVLGAGFTITLGHMEGPPVDATWADEVALSLRDRFIPGGETDMGSRPTLITARDPVLVDALAAALGGQGTEVRVAYADETLADEPVVGRWVESSSQVGTPLVSIMDGAFKESMEGAAEIMSGLGTSMEGGDDAQVRWSAEICGYETAEPGVPPMAWGCCGCKQGFSAGQTQACQRCHIAHYCSSSCRQAASESHQAQCAQWCSRTRSLVAPRQEPAVQPRSDVGREWTTWAEGSRMQVTVINSERPDLEGRSGAADGTVRSAEDGLEYKVQLLNGSSIEGDPVWLPAKWIRQGTVQLEAERAKTMGRLTSVRQRTQQLRRGDSAPLSTDEAFSRYESLKGEGNRLFRGGRHRPAIATRSTCLLRQKLWLLGEAAWMSSVRSRRALRRC